MPGDIQVALSIVSDRGQPVELRETLLDHLSKMVVETPSAPAKQQVSRVMTQLASNRDDVRRLRVRALGVAGTFLRVADWVDIEPVLLMLLEDQNDRRVRIAAARVLEGHSRILSEMPLVKSRLVDLVGDERNDASLRVAVLRILKEPELMDSAVIKMLQELASRDPDAEVREASVWFVSHYMSAPGVKEFLQQLFFHPNADELVRAAAGLWLVRDGDSSIKESLRKKVQSESSPIVRWSVGSMGPL